jgi:hypothetical protein
VPGGFGLAAMWEVAMLSLGVGVVPVVLATAWYRGSLRGEQGADARRYARVTLAVLGTLVAATLWAQGGWLESRSEERYFIYAIPLVWIAAAAAVSTAAVRPGTLLAGGAVIAAIIAATPNPVGAVGERFVLGPVSEVLAVKAPGFAGDLSQALGVPGVVNGPDLAAAIALAVSAVAALAWRRRLPWGALAAAALLQLTFVAFAFAGVHGRIDGVGGLTPPVPFSALDWADRASDGERLLLADQQVADREARQRSLLFWNRRLVQLLRIGSLGCRCPATLARRSRRRRSSPGPTCASAAA